MSIPFLRTTSVLELTPEHLVAHWLEAAMQQQTKAASFPLAARSFFVNTFTALSATYSSVLYQRSRFFAHPPPAPYVQQMALADVAAVAMTKKIRVSSMMI